MTWTSEAGKGSTNPRILTYDGTFERHPRARGPGVRLPDSLDIDTLYTAAAEAASQGDVTAAATLLRRALDLQVNALGPDHHDLAPTLNNLAMMRARRGRWGRSGALLSPRLRRDHAAGRVPDDPRVQVTRANLIAFLQAWGVAEPVVDVPDNSQPAAGLPSTPSPIAEASPSAAPPAIATASPDRAVSRRNGMRRRRA